MGPYSTQLSKVQVDLGGFYKGKLDGEPGDLTDAAFKNLCAAVRVELRESLAVVLPVSTQAPSDSSIGAMILTYAERFMGLVEAKANNTWDDPRTPGADARATELRNELLKIGWEPSYAYCIAGAEVVWRLAYAAMGKADVAARVGKLLTLGVVDSFNRCKDAGLISRVPVPGAIAFHRHRGTSNGHAYIVRRLNGNVLYTAEFNTSPNPGSIEEDRNGDANVVKTRPLNWSTDASLQLLGFLNPL